MVQAFTHEEEDRRNFQNCRKLFCYSKDACDGALLLDCISIYWYLLVWWDFVAWCSKVVTGEMSGGTLGQFIIYAIFVRRRLQRFQEVWGYSTRGRSDRTLGGNS